MIKNKKVLLAFIFLFPCIGIFSSCGNNEVIVTVINEDANKGTINGTSFKVMKNAYVKLEATPKTNYLFTGWYRVDNDGEYGEHFEPTYYYQANKNITFKAKWEDYSSKNFVFDLNEDNTTYKISRYYGNDKRIIVPNTHHGRKVTRICKETFIGIECNAIIIPDNITTIGDSAFYDCKVNKDPEIQDSGYVLLPKYLENCGTAIFKDWGSNDLIYLHSASIKEEGTSTTWGWSLQDNKISSHAETSVNAIPYKIIN